MILIRSLAFTFLAVLPFHAEAAVWTIGPTGYFGEIQQGVNAANDGDLLLVSPGQYDSVVIDDIAVSIIADPYGSVTVEGGITVRNLHASRTVVLAGLHVRCTSYDVRDVLIIEHCAGSVRLERCQFIHAGEILFPQVLHGAFIEHGDDVAFSHCVVKAGDATHPWFDGPCGMESTASTIAVYESTLHGGEGTDTGMSGGCAYRSENSKLFASGSGFFGGDGSKGFNASSLLPAGKGGDGGDGVLLTGIDARFYPLDCTCIGGKGGAGGDGCGSYPPGNPGFPGEPIAAPPGTVHPFDGSAFDFLTSSPVREAEIAWFEMEGEPGSQSGLFISADTGTMLLHGLKGQFLLSLAPMPIFLYLGQLELSGVLNVSVTIPELGPGVDFVKLHLQAYFWNSGDLEVLGPSQTLFLLDSSY